MDEKKGKNGGRSRLDVSTASEAAFLFHLNGVLSLYIHGHKCRGRFKISLVEPVNW